MSCTGTQTLATPLTMFLTPSLVLAQPITGCRTRIARTVSALTYSRWNSTSTIRGFKFRYKLVVHQPTRVAANSHDSPEEDALPLRCSQKRLLDTVASRGVS